MKEFKGTKGNWELSLPTSIHINEGKDNSIEIDVWHNHQEENQARSNAKLIAASPDLLEALQKLLEKHVELVSCGDCGNWDVEEEDEVIKARKAINKALK